jgi:hypothetical protein
MGCDELTQTCPINLLRLDIGELPKLLSREPESRNGLLNVRLDVGGFQGSASNRPNAKKVSDGSERRSACWAKAVWSRRCDENGRSLDRTG